MRPSLVAPFVSLLVAAGLVAQAPAPRVTTSGPLDLGVVDLPAGEVELVFTLLGSNDKAKPRRMVGVDYVRLERLP
ncbi:MAG: hypothetical protein FJ301_10360 [Planctomycetes bacterium]|nr:hypothetical protein [Planctomycetota bacterium]